MKSLSPEIQSNIHWILQLKGLSNESVIQQETESLLNKIITYQENGTSELVAARKVFQEAANFELKHKKKPKIAVLFTSLILVLAIGFTIYASQSQRTEIEQKINTVTMQNEFIA